ncbi:tubulin-folding cofactor B-like [Acanthaster planci]|uniref:Tubulin-folding cofactor B-like n=1 Tax=Acanthaster planci TaxID=133434 RepID=A0A8B7Y536_ACAPL|nr:tubulin-folding cofactor B-like [Acanthaster planci]
MAQEFSVVTSSYVNLQITSTLNNFPSEKRFQKDVTIGALKSKLELVTGSASSAMELQLFNKEGQLVVVMNDNDKMLGFYPVEDGMRIHVQDSDPNRLRGEFEDLSKVEKYEITDEDYAKRTDSVLAFKKKHKIGQFKEVDPEEASKQAALKEAKEAEEERIAGAIEVGARCEVNMPSAPPVKRGTVMFVGKTDFKPGFWIGVKYDEPLGKNDGSVQGKRYFECRPKYGGFVKPQFVTVGDFPEEDLDLDDDEM